MTIPTNADRRQPKLTQHDLHVYKRMVENLRTRHYAVGAQECADAISNLLFHVNQLMADEAPVSEARHARHA